MSVINHRAPEIKHHVPNASLQANANPLGSCWPRTYCREQGIFSGRGSVRGTVLLSLVFGVVATADVLAGPGGVQGAGSTGGSVHVNEGINNKATMEPTKPMVSSGAASTKTPGNGQQNNVNQKGVPYVPPELFPSKHPGGAR